MGSVQRTELEGSFHWLSTCATCYCLSPGIFATELKMMPGVALVGGLNHETHPVPRLIYYSSAALFMIELQKNSTGVSAHCSTAALSRLLPHVHRTPGVPLLSAPFYFPHSASLFLLSQSFSVLIRFHHLAKMLSSYCKLNAV